MSNWYNNGLNEQFPFRINFLRFEEIVPPVILKKNYERILCWWSRYFCTIKASSVTYIFVCLQLKLLLWSILRFETNQNAIDKLFNVVSILYTIYCIQSPIIFCFSYFCRIWNSLVKIYIYPFKSRRGWMF